MNDFSELEKELRKLRPTQPSPVLFERVGEALKDSRAGIKERRSLAPPLGRSGDRPSLVVVRLRPRCCRGFDFVRGGYHGTSARAPTNRRAKFACARNTTGSARDGTIHISQQVRSCRWDESRLQRPRRRIAFC